MYVYLYKDSKLIYLIYMEYNIFYLINKISILYKILQKILPKIIQ